MKKIILAFAAAMCMALTSCGAGWELNEKEGHIASTYINRKVIVTQTFTGVKVWEREGKMFIINRGDNNVTVSWKDENGDVQKIDFLGLGYSLIDETY